MLITLVPFLLLFQSVEVPYRTKEDFQVELKYELRSRPASGLNTVHLDPTGTKTAKSGMLPYLLVTVKVFNVTEAEARFKCEDNTRHIIFNRKLPKAASFVIDMGFIDDIKDGITPNNFNVYAVSDKKVQLNRIELKIEKDGTFLVNGEKRGKF